MKYGSSNQHTLISRFWGGNLVSVQGALPFDSDRFDILRAWSKTACFFTVCVVYSYFNINMLLRQILRRYSAMQTLAQWYVAVFWQLLLVRFRLCVFARGLNGMVCREVECIFVLKWLCCNVEFWAVMSIYDIIWSIYILC